MTFTTASSSTNTELLARFRAGDNEALAELMTVCQRRLSAYISNQFPLVPAEDVCQDAWTKAWSKRESFRDDTLESFRAWLFTIAYHEAIDQLRKRRHAQLPDNFDPVAPECDRENEWVEKLTRCIEQYSLQQEPSVLLVVAQMRGETIRQAMDRLSLPSGTVASQRNRGKALLRKCVGFHIRPAP